MNLRKASVFGDRTAVDLVADFDLRPRAYRPVAGIASDSFFGCMVSRSLVIFIGSSVCRKFESRDPPRL